LHITFKWFIHLLALGLSKEDEHQTSTGHGVWYSLPLRTAVDAVCLRPEVGLGNLNQMTFDLDISRAGSS